MSLGVLVALVALTGLGLLLPRTYQIETSVRVAAPPDVVYQHIVNLDRWNLWALDSMSLVPDPQQDSVYYWEDQSGKGSLTLIESIPNEKIAIQISMHESSFQSISTFSLSHSEKDSTVVVWNEQQNLGYNFIARYYAFFADFEEQVTENYQYGLQKLKRVSEQAAGSARPTIPAGLEESTMATWLNREEVFKLMSSLDGSTIAEIGAKHGYFTFELATKAKQVIALETNRSFAEYLRNVTDSANSQNVEVRLTGIISPALYEKEADWVLLTHTWGVFKNKTSYLQRIKRGLKPDGKLLVLAFTENIPNGYPAKPVDLKEILDMLQKAGFKLETQKELSRRGHWAVIAIP